MTTGAISFSFSTTGLTSAQPNSPIRESLIRTNSPSEKKVESVFKRVRVQKKLDYDEIVTTSLSKRTPKRLRDGEDDDSPAAKRARLNPSTAAVSSGASLLLGAINSIENEEMEAAKNHNIRLAAIELASLIDLSPSDPWAMEQNEEETVNLENGSSDTGQSENNRFLEKGVINKTSRDKEASKDVISEGTVTYQDGTKYVGKYKNGLPHGQGILAYPNGLRYEGGMQDGYRHGQGIVTLRGHTIYDGAFVKGKRHGQGTQHLKDGRIYKGEFINDRFHGLGILTFPNGDCYGGGFKDCLFHGKGILSFNGKTLKGEFAEGKFVPGSNVYS